MMNINIQLFGGRGWSSGGSGSRGGSSGKAGSGASVQAIKNALAGNKVALDYALMKQNEYGNVKGGGTKKTREAFEMWNDEVKRLQEERRILESVAHWNPDNESTQAARRMVKKRGIDWRTGKKKV